MKNLYDSRYSNKPNVFYINGYPPVKVDKNGHFMVDDEYAEKILKSPAHKDFVFKAGDPGYKEAKVEVRGRLTNEYLDRLEEQLRKYEEGDEAKLHAEAMQKLQDTITEKEQKISDLETDLEKEKANTKNAEKLAKESEKLAKSKDAEISKLQSQIETKDKEIEKLKADNAKNKS